MLDSIILFLGEAFLDTVIDHTFDEKNTKKRQIFYSTLFLLVILFYLFLLGLMITIAVTTIQEDPTTSRNLFLVSLLLFAVFIIYGIRVYKQWKHLKNKKSKH